MLPASNRGAGQNLGFPDVCLTPAPPAPPIPVPYPNLAMNAQALGFSTVVKISGVNALNKGSSIPMTSGDEAGSANPTIKGQSKYSMGNPIVKIDRLPAINLACPTTGNKMNNPLGAVLVPSAVNVTFCRATAAVGGEVGDAELRALGEAMASAGVRAERLPGDVALLTIPGFAPGVTTEVHRALAALGEGIAALVIDLRGNPGGDLDAAVALAGALLPEGAIVARLREDDGDPRVIEARGGDTSLPVWVLIDRRTASAAELFAAALQGNGRAVLVGERSYGKTTAHRLAIDPASGESRRVEVARWSIEGASEGAIDGVIEGARGLCPEVTLVPSLAEGGPDLWVKTAWALAVRAVG